MPGRGVRHRRSRRLFRKGPKDEIRVAALGRLRCAQRMAVPAGGKPLDPLFPGASARSTVGPNARSLSQHTCCSSFGGCVVMPLHRITRIIDLTVARSFRQFPASLSLRGVGAISWTHARQGLDRIARNPDNIYVVKAQGVRPFNCCPRLNPGDV